ncbi:MAG: alpha/beta hydrolase-fold protein, partial [Planctomycetaceae bacterium]
FLESLRDARRRFRVYSDRVFLSGHGMGGDAAFDIGMSHPDLFAGVIPIAGIADHYTMWYWQNAEHVAWYVVGGELDRDSLSQNSRELSRMMRHGFDVTYVEYTGRGYEDYFEEIHNLFDWMDLHRRVDLTAVGEFEFRTLRPHDNQFYWLEVQGLPDKVVASPVVSSTPGQRVFPLTLKAKATVGNTVYLTSGAEANTLWLFPGLVDFEQRLTVKLNGRTRFNDFPEAHMEDMLEDYRRRGDRQRIVWRKLEF